MKLILTIICILLITGCTKVNKFGDCIGILEKEDPKLRYDYSVSNILVAAIFSETIVVPGIVLFKDLYCPIGVK